MTPEPKKNLKKLHTEKKRNWLYTQISADLLIIQSEQHSWQV
jgi:hypothetical protein